MKTPVKTCSVSGCEARAWHKQLCNLHALQRYRSPRRQPPLAERLAEGKRLLRKRAHELGIQLASECRTERPPQQKRVEVSLGAKSKVRSPVG